MTEIHVINRHNRSFYQKILKDYHRLRHDIFVGERQWADLFKSDGLDIDQYDNDNAIYLVALEGEKVVGGQRLYPTLLPHMISEVFTYLVDDEIPVSSDILEWTRYFIVKERRKTETDCKLLASVQRYCLEEGISHLTAVGEMWWLPRWHQYGFSVHPMGLPQTVGGQPAIAVRIDISEESYASVLRVGGLKPTALTRHALQPAAIDRISSVA